MCIIIIYYIIHVGASRGSSHATGFETQPIHLSLNGFTCESGIAMR